MRRGAERAVASEPPAQPHASPGASPSPDLKDRVVSALKWSAAGKLLGQLISWTVTLYVMRRLDPSHYGLMGMATVAISFLMVINELGLGATLVQRKNLDELAKRQVFGLVLMVNAGLFALLFLAAPWIAAYYKEPEVAPVTRALAFQLLMTAFLVVPQAMLERELDFRRQSIVFLVASLMASVVQIVLVELGFGVWCLVWSNVVLLGVRVVGLNVIHPFLKLPVLSLRGAGELARYGGVITASRVIWCLYGRSDVVIGGRILGKTLIGFYDAAMHYATLPMQKLGFIINQVALPAFARIQEQPEEVRRHFLGATRALAFFAFPVLWGISAVSRESVALLLGPKWAGIVVPLQLLSLAGPVRMIANFGAPVYQAVGRPKYEFFDLVRMIVVMVPAFLVGSSWGVLGLSLVWFAVYPLMMLLNISINYPRIGVRVTDMFRAIRSPLLAALAMYGVVALVRALAPEGLGPAILLPILVAAGAATYTLVALRLDPGLRALPRALFRR